MRILVSIIYLFIAPVMAADLEREARWAEQIVDAILVGEPVWLEAGDHKFLSIQTGAEDGGQERAVILMHGIGVHPDWPAVINPLREQLPEHGWATLSLQLPVLAADAQVDDYYPVFPEAYPRIDSAVHHLKAQGYKTIVLVAHSLGSQMAAGWLAQQRDADVQGFVAIGMTGRTRDGHGSTLDYLAAITVPVLDLYGEADLPTVLDSNAARAAAPQRAGNTAYRQREVSAAGHMFEGQNEALLDAVVNWLSSIPR